MATLKNTTINDTGFITVAAATTTGSPTITVAIEFINSPLPERLHFN